MQPIYIRQEQRFEDPSNVLIRPLPNDTTTPQTPDPRWTSLADPGCDADVLQMETCELAFLGRPKRVRYYIVSSRAELSDFPRTGGPLSRRSLTEHGFLALLQPAEAEHEALDELGLPRAQNFAIACFDVAEDRNGVDDCWYLPLLRDKREGLLLHKDPKDGKFRRLGLVALAKEQVRLFSSSSIYRCVHMRVCMYEGGRAGEYVKVKMCSPHPLPLSKHMLLGWEAYHAREPNFAINIHTYVTLIFT